MHFTIERKRLVKMLESVRRKLPGQKKKDKEVRFVCVCGARVRGGERRRRHGRFRSGRPGGQPGGTGAGL